MSDRTPTTEQVRDLYVLADPAGYKARREYVAEFDRWLKQVQAEAWGEGFDAGERDALDLDTHPDHTCTPNPYRQETDR